jgi:hypothetical protein
VAHFLTKATHPKNHRGIHMIEIAR